MTSPFQELDNALESELQKSQDLQEEILKEYKSLEIILSRFERYKNENVESELSFFEYNDALEEEDKRIKKELQDIKDHIANDICDSLPLMSTSDFLGKVGQAFSKLPTSKSE